MTFLFAAAVLIAGCQQPTEGDGTTGTAEKKQTPKRQKHTDFSNQMIIDNFKDFIIPISVIVSEDYFNKSELNKYETFTFDSTGSSPLSANYHFDFYDEQEDYRMNIQHWIFVEETEEAAIERAKLINAESWSRLDKHIKEKNFIKANADSTFTYGDESHLTLIQNQFQQLFGFYCYGRVGRVVATHSVVSNHMGHTQFENMLIIATDGLQRAITGTQIKSKTQINE